MAAAKQSDGVRAATIGMGDSPWRPNIAASRSVGLALGGHARRRTRPLDVDDDHGQLEHDAQADGLLLEVQARAAGAGDPQKPAEGAPRAAPAAAISSSAWNVRTPKFFCRDSSWSSSEAGVIG